VKIRYRAAAAAFAIAVTGALGLAAAAAPAGAAVAHPAAPVIRHARGIPLTTAIYTITSHSGKAIYVDPDPMSVILLAASDATQFQIVGEKTSGGHTYYQYQDILTGLCIQATVNAEQMSAGYYSATSTRQFWFWNSMVLVNLAFQNKAYVEPPSINVWLGSGGGDPYYWSVTQIGTAARFHGLAARSGATR
jgi:hypothetical protein